MRSNLEIIEIITNPKMSHLNDGMECHDFGRFSVLTCNKNLSIIVDTEIAHIVKKRKWCLSHGYPVVNISGKLVHLHDFVMAYYSDDDKPNCCYVDHINQDKLDNRRNNLRYVTPEESSQNMPIKANNTSGYTGVYKTKTVHFVLI